MSKEQYIEFPEEYTRRELNARYREIPLKDTTSRLLRKYFNAMANLYGIIPLHKAREIIFSLSPKLVTADEFLAFAEIARHECEDYYILGGDELYTDVKYTKPLDREIIDVTLINESIDLFMETKRSQQDKPYYVPDKKHLLEYDDPFYCEDTPEKQKLRAFLKERCNLNDERENAVFEELLYGVRSVAVQTGDVLNHLEKLGVQLRSRRDVERFTALYSAFHNTTRMPCNRGYTPDEMMQMTPPEERFKSLSLGPNIRKALQTGEMNIEDFRKQILTMELPSEAIRFDLLKQLADRRHIAILLIHHLRKLHDDDPMNMISGSTGLSGAADSTFVFQKNSRLANVASLHCTGRDIPDRTLKLEFGEEDHIWKLLEDSKTCSGASKISTLQLVHLFSELLRADSTYLGSPSALSAKIDPDGTLGITPKKITRLVRESVAALRENGILADTYRSNGKRWISLKRAESADFPPVKTIGTIDPAGVPNACTAP